jgi:beta-N-acetylhexosaminidase
VPQKIATVIILTLFLLTITPIVAFRYTAGAATASGLDSVVAGMSLEDKVGQMLIITIPGTKLSGDTQSIIKGCRPGGIVLYANNIASLEQTVQLTDQLQNSSRIPLVIAIDEEGGLVSRLPFGTAFPGAMALGAACSVEYARAVGQATGEELKALGINTDLAPVLDVTGPRQNTLGVRAFGSDPRLTADLSSAYIKGLQEAGVAATAKHFPGLGRATIDAHQGLPVINANQEQLQSVDLYPFQQAFGQGLDMIMTAHAAYPALDPTRNNPGENSPGDYLPATLSSRILTDLARNQMGFQGIIVSDALNMKAISPRFGSQEQAAIAAVKAGVDVVMVYSKPKTVHRRLVDAVKRGEIPEARINASVKRLLALKLKRQIAGLNQGTVIPAARPPIEERISTAKSMVNSPAHQSMARLAAAGSVTVLENEGVLPLQLQNGDQVVLFGPSSAITTTMTRAWNRCAGAPGRQVTVKSFQYRNLGSLTAEQQKSITNADYIILGSWGSRVANFSAWQVRFPAQVVAEASRSGKPLVFLDLDQPYDHPLLPSIRSYLAVYGYGQPNVEAGMQAILGQSKPSGHLPVTISGGNQP